MDGARAPHDKSAVIMMAAGTPHSSHGLATNEAWLRFISDSSLMNLSCAANTAPAATAGQSRVNPASRLTTCHRGGPAAAGMEPFIEIDWLTDGLLH